VIGLLKAIGSFFGGVLSDISGWLAGVLALALLIGVAWVFGFLGATVRRGVDGLRSVREQERRAYHDGLIIDPTRRRSVRLRSVVAVLWPISALLSFYVAMALYVDYRLFLFSLTGAGLAGAGYKGYFLAPDLEP
jgi:MFS family permease